MENHSGNHHVYLIYLLGLESHDYCWRTHVLLKPKTLEDAHETNVLP